MKLNERLKAARNAFRQKSTSEQMTLDQLVHFLGISPTLTGPALSEATYFACIKVLTESIAKLPFRVLQRSERAGVTTMQSNEWWSTVHISPNRFMTATVFWSLMETYRNHYGNAYAVIDTTSEPGKNQLWPLDPEHVKIIYDDARRLADQPDLYYQYDDGKVKAVYESEEVLHFKSHLTYRGLIGRSVREQLKDTVQGQIKAQKMVNALYDNGMTSKAVLQYTGGLNEENVKTLVQQIQDYSSGGVKGTKGQIIPIPIGFSLQPLNLKLADSQFFEIKQASALQIAAAFGVKPSQIGDYSKSSYASAEAQQLAFLVDTLMYIVKGYSEELTYKLLSDSDIAKGMEIRAQTDVLLRADRQTKIQTLGSAVNQFLMTANEARMELDLPAVEGGDKLLGNGAAIPIEAVGTQYQ